MTTITIEAIALPLFLGFSIYLLPKFDRYLALGVAIVSTAYGLQIMFNQPPVTVELLDHFGVTLLVDELSGYFILTNGLVTLAVILYCWGQGKTAFFYTQAIILHGSVNAVFLCEDFISLYVALEVISIASFLLIAYPRTDRSIWVALRYLFIGNTVMLFYLIGVALVYKAHHSFDYAGLHGSPPEAIALIFMALLAKGGIFVSGLWLPLTHSESETPVSAILSGVVVKTGVFPLLRLALVVPEVDPIVRIFGVGTALFGVSQAVFEKDAKRMLAFHTISQLGFILAAPAVGGFYALTHGLVKSCLFLGAGNLPTRNFKELQYRPIATSLWIPLVMASFSISGVPLFAGFGAKALSMKNFLPWQAIPMNVAAVGTAISFAKFIFLPHQGQEQGKPTPSPYEEGKSEAIEPTPSPYEEGKSKAGEKEITAKDLSDAPQKAPKTHEKQKTIQPGFWWATIVLIGGLILGNMLYLKAYTIAKITKSLVTIAIGWSAYWLIFKRSAVKLPRVLEEFEHLIGVMALMLIALFWMVLGIVKP